MNGLSLFGSVFLKIKTAIQIIINDVNVPKLQSSAEIFKSINNAQTITIKPEHWVPFAPNGMEGIFTGAFVIFFAYVGFDAISTAAEETNNPQRDLPVAIMGTLVLCTVLYILVALVLTGVVPLNAIDTQAPLAHAMRFIGNNWYAGLISVGALCALTTVLLIYQLGTTRILFAMSRDNFLPK